MQLGEKGYKEGHEHDEGKKGHHDKVRTLNNVTHASNIDGIIFNKFLGRP